LGIGIGATSSIFSIVYSSVLRPLPYGDPGGLVAVSRPTRGVSYPDFRDWREQNSTLLDLGGYAEATSVFRQERGADQIRGTAVSVAVLPLLAARPLLGRWFTEAEDVIGAADVVILHHDLWMSRFGGDSSIVGRNVTIDDSPHTVVGVMPRGFTFPDENGSYWVPLRGDRILREMGITSGGRGLGFLDLVGRLRPGVPVQTALRDLSEVAARIDEAELGPGETNGVSVEALHDFMVGSVRPLLATFFGAVALLLAIACANVASLWLTRTSTRSREIALRTALGASAGRVVRQLLTESFLLALLGGALGLGVAVVATKLVVTLGSSVIPRSASVGLNGAVVAFTTVVAVASGMAVGLLPAWQSARRDLAPVLRESSKGGDARGGVVTRQVLVVAQITLACMLLTSAGLLMNSFARLMSTEIGIDTENLVTVRVTLPVDEYESDAKVMAFFDELVERTRALAGVARVATVYSPPFAEQNFQQSLSFEGHEPLPEEDRLWAGNVIVGPGYLATAGVPLLRGREFTRQDGSGAPQVAVVNQAMARRFWPDEDALGKRFRATTGISGSVESLERRFFTDEWITVVGVAADVRRRRLDAEPEAEFYRPHRQMAWPGMALLVRTTEHPGPIVPAIQEQVWALNANIPVTSIGTIEQLVTRSVATPRFRTVILGAFAGAAGLLAVIGVYGVMAFVVVQRTQEIGIRMALGAGDGRVLREVLVRGLRMSGLGIILGLGLALVTSRLVSTMLFGITPHDPLTYGGIAALLLSVALLACYVPARRGSRVDPTVALHE
jgi:putative ABC transport system permease protein